ncbi:class I SAM-dependent methyltransferase [Patescibacteria group bacterium]
MKKNKRKQSGLIDVEEGYTIYAKEYQETEEYLDTFDRNALMLYLKNLKGKKILDVGAGSGRIINILDQDESKIVALDSSKEMLELLKKKYSKVETVLGDAEKLPFEDESFDVVVATFLIVHLKRLDKFFDEVHRILRPGGFKSAETSKIKE